ncbi:MAG: hypothetical protein AB7E63_03750 [Parachlamydia sp.]|nr:hypothetical protein pah_c026o048 [Parachlamydia acanthamoebae str. Hall's coccus]
MVDCETSANLANFLIVDMGKYRHLEGCFTAPLLMQGKEAPSA